MSWIHVDDLVGLILHCIDTPSVSGPVNGTAPNPVTNAEFSKELGKALARPSLAPAPGFMLKLALGEMAEMLLGGQRVLPRAAVVSGYEFHYPKLPEALDAVIND
jgi:NAD dependent epimerase/dehydratase family enzyme